MLWLRALIFTVLVPGMVAIFIPQQITGSRPPRGGWWSAGWLPSIGGALIYLRCLLSFIAAQGTPAIFFTRHLRSVLREEPGVLVRRDLYKFTRNPMYLGVLAVIFGQAIVFGSVGVALYGVLAFVFFHAVVTLFEEPHLKSRDRVAFEDYCRSVPRWLGLPRSRAR
jgi:protein-S-isoprenylcysteine O-methyltransferase Ste14